jgi:hypothetical protein
MSRPNRAGINRWNYKLIERGGEAAGFGNDLENDAEKERQLIRKIDKRIMPCLFAMIVFKQVSCHIKLYPSNQYIAT